MDLSERCFNHLDEMVSAQSVCFDAAGERIYAGLTNEVRVFDVSVPGKGGGGSVRESCHFLSNQHYNYQFP